MIPLGSIGSCQCTATLELVTSLKTTFRGWLGTTKEIHPSSSSLPYYTYALSNYEGSTYPPHPSSPPLWSQVPIPRGWWHVMTPNIGWKVAGPEWYTGSPRDLWFAAERWGRSRKNYRCEVGGRFGSQETLRWSMTWEADAKSIVSKLSWCCERLWSLAYHWELENQFLIDTIQVRRREDLLCTYCG